MPAVLASSPEFVRCQTLWQLADASRHLLAAGGPSAQCEALQVIQAEQCHAALQETSRLTLRAFGVGLGQVVTLRASDALWEVCLDFLRPTSIHDTACIAASGRTPEGKRVLAFLGYDSAVEPSATRAQLWALEPWRQR